MRWRIAVLPLLLVCLALRTAFPAGWMPMFGPDGVSIMLCPGWDGASGADQQSMEMAGHADRASHAPDKSNHPASDHPCAFSVVAASDPVAALTAVAPPLVKGEAPFVQARIVWADRSLSAPPPPSTGPPIPA
jgi:hypothetical protein